VLEEKASELLPESDKGYISYATHTLRRKRIYLIHF
jgi:hypothetical protein